MIAMNASGPLSTRPSSSSLWGGGGSIPPPALCFRPCFFSSPANEAASTHACSLSEREIEKAPPESPLRSWRLMEHEDLSSSSAVAFRRRRRCGRRQRQRQQKNSPFFLSFFGWGKIKMQVRNIRLKTEAGAAAAPVAEALPRRGESFACGERETKRGAGERVLQKASIVEQRTKTKAQP